MTVVARLCLVVEFGDLERAMARKKWFGPD
jgi:hypothetical protein